MREAVQEEEGGLVQSLNLSDSEPTRWTECLPIGDSPTISAWKISKMLHMSNLEKMSGVFAQRLATPV